MAIPPLFNRAQRTVDCLFPGAENAGPAKRDRGYYCVLRDLFQLLTLTCQFVHMLNVSKLATI